MTNNTQHSWETKAPHEPSKAYKYFITYMQMGNQRSLKKLQELTNDVGITTLEKYSSKYNWAKRIDDKDAYDAEQLFKKNEEELKSFFANETKSIEKSNNVIDEMMGSIYKDYKEGLLKSTSVAHSLKSLMEAKNTSARLYMRMKGVSETITESKQDIKADVGMDLNVELPNPKLLTKQIDEILASSNDEDNKQ